MAFNIDQAQVPSLARRLAALLYDLIVLFGMLLFATMLVIIPASTLSGVEVQLNGWLLILFRIYLVAVSYGFFAYFWIHGGQTLGMRAWRLCLIQDNGHPLSLAATWRRLLWSTLIPAPVGLLLIPFDSSGLAPHDRLSHTRPVLLTSQTLPG
jgi:uncharacterized RDD family membrane protein YckC